MKKLLGAFLFVCATITATAIGVHVAVHRTYVENERALQIVWQTPEGPRDETSMVPITHGYTFSLEMATQLLTAKCGLGKDQISFLTAITGKDDKDNQFTINASPKFRFTPPYVVASDADIAAWEKDPQGLLVSIQIATPNHWKVGDTITVHHQGGDVSGRIAAIVGGMSPKVYFHPAYLDTQLPPELRAHARYVAFPRPLDPVAYAAIQKTVEAALEEAGTPGWLLDGHEFIAMSFNGAGRLVAWTWLAFILGACFCVVVACVHSLQGASLRSAFLSFAICATGAVLANAALYLRYKDGAERQDAGIPAAHWFMASVPVSLGDAGRAVAIILAITVLALVVGGTWSRIRDGWLAGVILFGAITATATGLVLAYENLAHLHTSTEVTVPERLGDVPLRGHDGIVRGITLRGTSNAGIDAHGVHIDGRFPAPGEHAVVVGASLLPLYPDLDRNTLLVGLHRWPVTGVLHAPGTTLESEIWCDRAACEAELGPAQPPDPEHPFPPSPAVRLADYRAPYIGALAALALASIFAALAALGLARKNGRMRAAPISMLAALTVALVATVAVIVHHAVSLGAPVLAIRIALPAPVLAALALLVLFLLAVIVLVSRSAMKVAP